MLLLHGPLLMTVRKVDCVLLFLVSGKEHQRIKKKKQSLLATISGLGLRVIKMSKFQDTKVAVTACLLISVVVVGEVMEILMGG